MKTLLKIFAIMTVGLYLLTPILGIEYMIAYWTIWDPVMVFSGLYALVLIFRNETSDGWKAFAVPVVLVTAWSWFNFQFPYGGEYNPGALEGILWAFVDTCIPVILWKASTLIKGR